MIFCSKTLLKKSSLYHHILFTVSMRCRYFKGSNDTPKLNIHRYTNHDIIDIHLNRLSTTTKTFIMIDYLIRMSKK